MQAAFGTRLVRVCTGWALCTAFGAGLVPVYNGWPLHTAFGTAGVGLCALLPALGWCYSTMVGACTLIPAPGWCESAEAGRCTLPSSLDWCISTTVAPCTLLSAMGCYVFAAHRTQRPPAGKRQPKNKVCAPDHVETRQYRVCPKARTNNHHSTYGWCGPAEGPTDPRPSAGCGFLNLIFLWLGVPVGCNRWDAVKPMMFKGLFCVSFFLF